MTTPLPRSILDRAERLAELNQTHRPTFELTEAVHLMTEMLHIAVHGETWARPKSPQQVWLGLLTEVASLERRLAAAEAEAYAADNRAERAWAAARRNAKPLDWPGPR